MASRVSTVVQQGDPRLSLEAIRDRLARELDEAFGRDVAVIAKQLVDVIRLLEAMPVANANDPVDQLKAKRAQRIARTASA